VPESPFIIIVIIIITAGLSVGYEGISAGSRAGTQFEWRSLNIDLKRRDFFVRRSRIVLLVLFPF